ncbi:hypothetical protein HA466_0095630 [Hirschfeldia incana]|nr:hypothetical protein HA466_0095630 [Hirschfeldia incana]
MNTEPDPGILAKLRDHLPAPIFDTLVEYGLCSVSIEHIGLICSPNQLQAAIDMEREREGDLSFNYHGSTGVLLLVCCTHDPDFTNGQERTLKVKGRIRKHVGRVRNQFHHRLCWAYAAGDVVSSARVLGELDDAFIPFCPMYLCQNIEPKYLGPDKTATANGEIHHCYESTIERALNYFCFRGVPRELKEHKKFRCTKPPQSQPYTKYRIRNTPRRFRTIGEALTHLVVTGHPVGADLLLCDELWKPSMKSEIYRGPLHQLSPVECYHSVLIVALDALVKWLQCVSSVMALR